MIKWIIDDEDVSSCVSLKNANAIITWMSAKIDYPYKIFNKYYGLETIFYILRKSNITKMYIDCWDTSSHGYAFVVFSPQRDYLIKSIDLYWITHPCTRACTHTHTFVSTHICMSRSTHTCICTHIPMQDRKKTHTITYIYEMNFNKYKRVRMRSQ